MGKLAFVACGVVGVGLALPFVGGARARGRNEDPTRSITVGGITRTYLLHVPAPLPRDARVPLVLVFHGGGGHARNMPRFSGFDALADEQGFFVAYPESFNTHWNDGRGLSPADDMAFIRALITQVEHANAVDPKRIYATGMSNGGFLSQRLACDLADQIAAVASVAATMPEPLVPMCKPARPISVMFIQGTKDPLVHIEGGTVARKNGRNISLAEATAFWTKVDQTAPGTSVELPDRVGDGTHVRKDVHGGGRQGTEVVVYTIENGGHTWPGGSQYLPAFVVGKASKNLDATQVIWEFFQKHKLE